MLPDQVENVLLRIGVAFAFLYPPINAFFDPLSWLGYFPKFIHGILPDVMLLHGFGIIEALIALWILSGKKIFLPSTVATIVLMTIVLFNVQEFQVVFRDVSIAIMSLVLAIHARRQNTSHFISSTSEQ